VAEGVLAVMHLIQRLVARRLGLEPATRSRGGDPFDSVTGSSDDLSSSSGEQPVVAELVEPRSKHIPSSVELVPLKVDTGSGQPAPPNSIRFRCAACGGSITVESKFAGRRGQCPECLAEFTIPRDSAPSAVASSSASASRPREPHDRAQERTGESSGARRASAHSTRPPGSSFPPPPQERRRANRVSVIDGRIAYALDAFPGENQPPLYHPLEDLSLTGLSFVVKFKSSASPTPDVKVGDSLFLHLDFPAYVDKVRVQGEVRRVGLLPDRSGLAMGVRFSRFLDDAQAKVRRLVENGNLRGVKRR
jgi:hypothetical protein